MILKEQIDAALRRRGYRVMHETKKKLGFQKAGGTPVYLNLTSKDGQTALVMHPDLDITALASCTKGLLVGDAFYHSSNMRQFPKRMHRGSDPINFGRGCTFESEVALQATLDFLEGLPTSIVKSSGASEHREAASSAPGKDESSLGKRRVGQDQFRTALQDMWEGCAVTGLRTYALLRASHIKPWKDSDPHEKTDPHNGLLLAAHLDAAFDAGLITFQDDGRIRLSSRLNAEDARLLGIHSEMRLRSVTSLHAPYLQFHRQEVFCP